MKMAAARSLGCPLKFFDLNSYPGEHRLWNAFDKVIRKNQPKPGGNLYGNNRDVSAVRGRHRTT
jgi:hypothetical protein